MENENENINTEIREEAPGDFPAVYNMYSTAFARKDEARLADRLRLSNAFIPQLSLVALIDGKIVGHIMFTQIDIVGDEVTVGSLSLAPMAVVSEMQKKGIGSQLVLHGFQTARELGYRSVIVLGHETYYPRFGFVSTQKWKIKAPFNVPANVFMAFELVEDSLTDVTGVVRYAEEFMHI